MYPNCVFVSFLTPETALTVTASVFTPIILVCAVQECPRWLYRLLGANAVGNDREVPHSSGAAPDSSRSPRIVHPRFLPSFRRAASEGEQRSRALSHTRPRRRQVCVLAVCVCLCELCAV